jgi:hypothetical protein
MSEFASRHDLLRAMGKAGALWRRRARLEGACVAGSGIVLSAVVAVAVMDAVLFDPGVVQAVRIAAYVVAAALLLVFLLLRVPAARDPRRVARHLEQRDPALDALLVTAAERAAASDCGALESRLFERAAAACRDPRGATASDRHRLRRAGALLAGIAVVAGVGLWLAPPGWQHGAGLLLWPSRPAQQGMPYALIAMPGDTEVLEGSDLTLAGKAVGFSPAQVSLLYRVEGEAHWRRVAMQADGDQAFEGTITTLAAPLDYYLEAQGVRSGRHRVTVEPLPRVERMDHRYRFPHYTGRVERLVEGATDIAAVRGSRVQIEVTPKRWPARGTLLLDGEVRRALDPDPDGRLVAALAVEEASRYRIELLRPDGTPVPATPDHGITALEDQPPRVAIERPGGDTRATPVEELEVAVEAGDDVGLRRVELVLSVNGGPEEVLPLVSAEASATSLSTVHRLALEDRDLAPGDLVAVHARASDGVEARAAVTDIQFLEVRPFDRDYRRAPSSRQGGGGGGQQGTEGLAAQQRDLVVALFRLARDGGRLPGEEREERLTTLSEAQARIRGRVEAIVRRIRGRAMVQATPGYRTMLEELPRAASAMSRVEALLAVPDPEQGLPPARQALAHLQRADAAFREVQVAARSGGAGGGGRADNRDLSRLFELEMDRFRNRYSRVQRGAMQQRQQQVDETLEKLRELARRQREEVERAARRAAHSDLAGSGAATQQALAAQLEELMRRLERLSRERPSAATEETRRALEQAAEAMRRAGAQRPQQGGRQGQPQGQQHGQRQGPPQGQAGASGGQSTRAQAGRREPGQAAAGAAAGTPRAEPGRGGATRRGAAATSATDAAREALAHLERARRALAGDAPAQVARELDDAAQRADELAGRQQAMREAIERAPEQDVAARLAEKQRLEGEAAQLREQLDRIAAMAASGQPGVARQAREAAGVMREQDVEARLRRSREELAGGRPDPQLEGAIASALERTRAEVAQAAREARVQAQEQARAAGAGRGGAGAAGSAEQLRALMRELAGLRESLERGRGGWGAGPGGRDAGDLAARADQLGRLRGPVANNPDAAGDLEALIDGVRALAAEQTQGVRGAVDASQMLDAITALERALEAEAGEEATALVAPPSSDAPPRYRPLVDEYFRRLSEEPAR